MALYEFQYFRRRHTRKTDNHEINHACNDSTCTSLSDTYVCVLSSVFAASIDAAKKSIVIDSSTEVFDSSSSSRVAYISATLLSLGTHH